MRKKSMIQSANRAKALMFAVIFVISSGVGGLFISMGLSISAGASTGPTPTGTWQDAGIPDTDWFDLFPNRGTAEHPFLISNARELAGLASIANSGNWRQGGYVVLVNNINFGSRYWNNAIGSTAANAWHGTLHGNGFVIDNLTGTYSLFGFIGNGEINNLRLENVDIVGSNGLVGLNIAGTSLTIDNVAVIGSVTGRAIIGSLSNGILRNSFAKVNNSAGMATIVSSIAYGNTFIGDISSSQPSVGLSVFEATNNSLLIDNYASGEISVVAPASTIAQLINAGFVASGRTSVIERNFINTNVSIINPSTNVNSWSMSGGIIGLLSWSTNLANSTSTTRENVVFSESITTHLATNNRRFASTVGNVHGSVSQLSVIHSTNNFHRADLHRAGGLTSANGGTNGVNTSTARNASDFLDIEFYEQHLPNWNFDDVWMMTDHGPFLRSAYNHLNFNRRSPDINLANHTLTLHRNAPIHGIANRPIRSHAIHDGESFGVGQTLPNGQPNLVTEAGQGLSQFIGWATSSANASGLIVEYRNPLIETNTFDIVSPSERVMELANEWNDIPSVIEFNNDEPIHKELHAVYFNPGIPPIEPVSPPTITTPELPNDDGNNIINWTPGNGSNGAYRLTITHIETGHRVLVDATIPPQNLDQIGLWTGDWFVTVEVLNELGGFPISAPSYPLYFTIYPPSMVVIIDDNGYIRINGELARDPNGNPINTNPIIEIVDGYVYVIAPNGTRTRIQHNGEDININVEDPVVTIVGDMIYVNGMPSGVTIPAPVVPDLTVTINTESREIYVGGNPSGVYVPAQAIPDLTVTIDPDTGEIYIGGLPSNVFVPEHEAPNLIITINPESMEIYVGGEPSGVFLIVTIDPDTGEIYVGNIPSGVSVPERIIPDLTVTIGENGIIYVGGNPSGVRIPENEIHEINVDHNVRVNNDGFIVVTIIIDDIPTEHVTEYRVGGGNNNEPLVEIGNDGTIYVNGIDTGRNALDYIDQPEVGGAPDTDRGPFEIIATPNPDGSTTITVPGAGVDGGDLVKEIAPGGTIDIPGDGTGTDPVVPDSTFPYLHVGFGLGVIGLLSLLLAAIFMINSRKKYRLPPYDDSDPKQKVKDAIIKASGSLGTATNNYTMNKSATIGSSEYNNTLSSIKTAQSDVELAVNAFNEYKGLNLNK